MLSLSSLVAPAVDVMITYGATGEDKVAIMTTLAFSVDEYIQPIVWCGSNSLFIHDLNPILV